MTQVGDTVYWRYEVGTRYSMRYASYEAAAQVFDINVGHRIIDLNG